MIIDSAAFMQRAENIIRENVSWCGPDCDIENLIKSNPLSPEKMDGMPRIKHYPDVTLAENRTCTKKLIAMGVKRGDPIELRLTKMGTDEVFPVNVYWYDEKIGELRKGHLEETIFRAKSDNSQLFSAVSFIHEQMKFYIEIAIYQAPNK